MARIDMTRSKITKLLENLETGDVFNLVMLADMALSLASIADSLTGDEVESNATSSGDERGTGRWINVVDGIEYTWGICDKCGAHIQMPYKYYEYCPHCGRKMKTGDPGVKKDPEDGAQEWRVIDKEAPVPVSWIEKELEFLRSQDNEIAGLAAGNISGMLNKWRDEQNGKDDK